MLKIQIFGEDKQRWSMKIFQRVQIPYASRYIGKALLSRKLVVGDDSSEGSETANSGTDEQERYMRHSCLGKQAHHCNAQ